MSTFFLDFGAANAGLSPAFTLFRTLVSPTVAVTPPAIVEVGNGLYKYDYDPSSNAIVYKASLGGVEPFGVIGIPPLNRFVIDLGSVNTGGTPTPTRFANAVTGAPLTPPTLTEIAVGVFLFDYVPPAGVTGVLYKFTLNLTESSGTLGGNPVPGGVESLASLRLRAQQEADMENDPHVSTAEWNTHINASRMELYDILVTRFGEDYYSANATITTDGLTDQFPLPDGARYSGAPAYYKGALVESQVYGGPTGWVSLQKFNFHEKNKFRLLNYYTIMAQRLPRYRIVGSNLMLAPLPVSGIQVRMWYAPQLVPLVQDTDVAEDWSGWLEYVVVDAAIKAMAKQERDVSVLMARKQALKDRIEAAAQNRDLGEPNTVTEVQTDTFPFGAPFSIFGTGPWGGV